ncbi:MAG: F0F1 ATP synthase subunit B [Candidatus Paceibacterota bacterium]
MEEIISVFGINWKLLIIQGVNFGLLLVLLSYVLYRPVFKMINDRRAKIEAGIRNAKEADTRLEAIESEKKQVIQTATLKAEMLIQEGSTRSKVKEEEMLKEAQNKCERLITDAQMRSEEAQKKAEEESRAEVARLAILGAEKILRKN